MLTLWRNTAIATCDDQHRVFERGAVVTEGDTIAWVGAESELPAGVRPDRTIELAGRWLTPGLIDCHTHLVFAGQRAAEFAQRTAGTSYVEIAHEGGGILSTMRATRGASVDELVRQSEPRLRSLCAEGVTTVEIKSGYGLEFEAERRMLLAARQLGQRAPVTVVTSLLAAHAVPPGFQGRTDAYVEMICADWLPRLTDPHPNPPPLTREREQKLVDMVDAYCESIAFSTAQCDRILAAARARGLPVRLHTEQISNIGGSRMAASHGALACDHLEYTNERDVIELARAATVAVMLPIAWYVLADPQLPPIDLLRRHRVPMAVASDANPGSAPGASLQTAMHMARRSFGMTGTEVLDGVTRHAARALGLAATHGQLAPGYRADFAVWSVGSLDELGYWIGFNPCSMVVRHGEIVLERDA
jgi:imidazolonepropionase